MYVRYDFPLNIINVDNAWMSSDIYGTNTVRQILEGKYLKRAINAHMTTLIVLFNMYAMHLFKYHQNISSEIENLKSSCTDALDDDANTTEVVRNITSCYKNSIS